mgnify:CR=1 FL=1
MTSRNSQKLEGGERRVHPFPRKDLEDFDSPLPTPPFRPGSSFVVKSFDKWWGWERWGAGKGSVRVGFCWKRQLLQWDIQREKAALRLGALWGAAEEAAPRCWLGRLQPAQF